VQVLQPIALALLAAILALWCLLPGGFKRGGLEEVQRAREEGRDVEEGDAGVLSKRVMKLRRKIGIA